MCPEEVPTNSREGPFHLNCIPPSPASRNGCLLHPQPEESGLFDFVSAVDEVLWSLATHRLPVCESQQTMQQVLKHRSGVDPHFLF